MRHPFMEGIAQALAARAIATWRWEMTYLTAGRARPDPAPVGVAEVRAAVAARARRPELRLVAGGKSFGGRMTSTADASGAARRVEALVFLGFPLHPAGAPATTRAEHLAPSRSRCCSSRATVTSSPSCAAPADRRPGSGRDPGRDRPRRSRVRDPEALADAAAYRRVADTDARAGSRATAATAAARTLTRDPGRAKDGRVWTSYSTRAAAQLIGLPESAVRGLIRDGLMGPRARSRRA